jgi:hypothetical protein
MKTPAEQEERGTSNGASYLQKYETAAASQRNDFRSKISVPKNCHRSVAAENVAVAVSTGVENPAILTYEIFVVYLSRSWGAHLES